MATCAGDLPVALGRVALADLIEDLCRELQTRYPKVTLVPDRRFVQADAQVFSAGGLTSGVDLALHVVELYFGRAVAERTANYMEYESTSWRDGAVASARKSPAKK